MSTTTALRDYRERLAGIPGSRFIGSVLWYSVAGTVERGTDGKRNTVPVRVHQDELVAWFQELGLDQDYLPPRIKKIDAFRNATSQVRREYACGDEGSGQYATLRIEEVKSDNEQVIRHVVKDVRDERKEQLSRTHLATVKFIRGGRSSLGKRNSGDHVKTMVLSRTRGEDRDQVDELLVEFERRYEDLGVFLHSPALRGVIRDLLASLNAVAMKTSGGVYFVHKNRWADLDKVQKLMHCIGQGCVMEQFPLVDQADSRRMLTDAFESEVEDEVRLLLKDIAEANSKSGKVAARRYAEISARYRELEGRSAEYTELLDLAQGKAGDALELALTSITEMAQRIDFAGGTS
jgi:hypothetical protein